MIITYYGNGVTFYGAITSFQRMANKVLLGDGLHGYLIVPADGSEETYVPTDDTE